MAYSKYGLSVIDLANNAGQTTIFKYATTDSNATVQGANYFAFDAEDAEDLGNLLKLYDFIFIGSSDDADLYYISSVDPIVITQVAGDAPEEINLAENKILVGDATNKAAAVSMSGDVTIAANGTTTIGAGKVEAAMLDNASINAYILTMGTSAYGGGAASTTISIPGLTTNDFPIVNVSASTNPIYVKYTYPEVDTLHVVFDADPGAGTGINYMILRFVP